MAIDERQLNGLIEESQDLQVDAMRGVKDSIPDLQDIAADRADTPADPVEVALFNAGRRRLFGRLFSGKGSLGAAGLATGGIAASMAAFAAPAGADQNLDVMILQTASSLERLAVNTYKAAIGLPFIASGNPVVLKFAQTTMSQHDQHRQAFQAQTTALGGKVQDMPNPMYAPIVTQATPGLKTPADVVTLAMTLEQVATDTYLSDMAQFTDVKSKTIMASVMGVESQHLATLRAVNALLGANLPDLIAIPTDVTKLPAVAGSVSFPNPLEGTTKAVAPSNGALS